MNFKRDYPLRRSAGITVIEVIMVAVIIAILAVLTIPRFETSYVIKLETAAARLLSPHIRYIQTVAITRHTDTRLIFNESSETYSASYYDVDSNSWVNLKDPFTGAPLNVDFTTDSYYKGINILSFNFGGGDTLRFNWLGVPQDGNGNNLALQGTISLSYHSNTRIIAVEPNTGMVSLK